MLLNLKSDIYRLYTCVTLPLTFLQTKSVILLFVNLFIIYLFMYLFIYLFVYLFVYLFICLCIYNLLFFLFMLTEDRLLRGSNSSLSSCSSITSEQRTSFFIGQEIAEDSEMAPSSSFTRYMSLNK